MKLNNNHNYILLIFVSIIFIIVPLFLLKFTQLNNFYLWNLISESSNKNNFDENIFVKRISELNDNDFINLYAEYVEYVKKYNTLPVSVASTVCFGCSEENKLCKQRFIDYIITQGHTLAEKIYTDVDIVADLFPYKNFEVGSSTDLLSLFYKEGLKRKITLSKFVLKSYQEIEIYNSIQLFPKLNVLFKIRMENQVLFDCGEFVSKFTK